ARVVRDGHVLPDLDAAAVVEVHAAVDQRALADLQAPDVEEADAALQRGALGDVVAAEAIQRRAQPKRQENMDGIDRRKSEEVQLVGGVARHGQPGILWGATYNCGFASRTARTMDTTPSAQDDNQLIAERREKLAAIRKQGVAFPNDFKPKDRAADVI